MNNLPKEAISEFQSIYKKEFGIKLSQGAAKSEARRLLLFFHQYFLFIQNNYTDELSPSNHAVCKKQDSTI